MTGGTPNFVDGSRLLATGRHCVSGPPVAQLKTCYQRHHVLAVAGTGKTTTAILACVLEYAGLTWLLIEGGVPLVTGGISRLARSELLCDPERMNTARFFDKPVSLAATAPHCSAEQSRVRPR
jgi:hypothetical protein